MGQLMIDLLKLVHVSEELQIVTDIVIPRFFGYLNQRLIICRRFFHHQFKIQYIIYKTI
jgi:hypothetical protein